jgi:hypothetical protein
MQEFTREYMSTNSGSPVSDKNEKPPGRIFAVHIVDPLQMLDFIDLKKKENYLEQLKKATPWTGTLILSNPGKDLFDIYIRYISLVYSHAQSIHYLLDEDTGKIIFEKYNSPSVLKNLKMFAPNNFHFMLWSREFEDHVELMVGFSREKTVKGPYFYILCEKTAPCFCQLISDFRQWTDNLIKASKKNDRDMHELVLQIESRLRPLLQDIYEFNGLHYPNLTETINIENLIQNFYTYWKLRRNTMLFRVLWIKNEEEIALKKGGTSLGCKLIYFDLTRNELGSTTLFRDKYVLLKMFLVGNIIQSPILIQEERRYPDLTDVNQIQLINGYAEFNLRIIQKSAIQNQFLILYQDLDTKSQKIFAEVVYKDMNDVGPGDTWFIKGTGLRQNCFEIRPRFDWKGKKG